MLIFTALVSSPERAAAQRLPGLDVAAWQGNISAATWTNLLNNDNRRFVVLRASRGGTTGFYNQSDPNNNNGLNTLSQRYDDPYFVQNINRSTTAGLYAGSYHFSRPDIIETTTNSAGIRNSGADEADHFIQMAGAWMRPGYLLPIHDLEAGDGIRTDNEMAQFAIDFSNRIFERMGIRPGLYINGNYALNILQAASLTNRTQLAAPAALEPTMISPCYTILWSARWPTNAFDPLTAEPKDTYSGIYGPWDDYGITHPWTFWQYTSSGSLTSLAGNLDLNVVRGTVEFLKDALVPAVWTHNGNGDWGTLTNWNSGLAPVAPVTGPGQVAPIGTQTLPTARLPGAAGSGVTSGQHDTVILERTNASITVTLSSSSYNIRKLYQRETLNITGGALNVNFQPAADSGTNGAQFSGPATLSGTGSFTVHTLQVDAAQTFTQSGGTNTFNTVTLMPDAGSPARLLFSGDASLNARSNVTAVITNGSGAGAAGLVDLGGAARTLTIGNGTNDVDVSVDVAITNGGLTKAGAGTLQLTRPNTYAGGTIVNAGRLLVMNTTGSGTGSGAVNVNGGTLAGTGTITGALTLAGGGTLAPGTATTPGTLTFNSPAAFSGTNFLRVNRNGGSPIGDRVTLTAGTLNYGGTLVVTNIGAAMTGGEVFTLFSAPGYARSFATFALPTLASNLNWFTGNLTNNGTLVVNRRPSAGPLTFTNVAPTVLEIPIASLTGAASDPDSNPISFVSVNPTSTNGLPLLADSTFIYYSNYVSGPDQFSYTITDGRGGNATGTVQIASRPTGRFVGAPTGNAASITMQFAGQPGWTYFVERSTNLIAWPTIATNIAPPGGLFNFTDTFTDLGGPVSPSFYRLRWSE